MINFKEPSTKTGLILLGSVAAGLITGNAELVTVNMGESGAQLGGTIPMVVGAVVGLWDMIRKEKG
ncbi:hypothetical protein MD588_18925 [Photobacterium sp. SDRW27]|uniref:hypothetical protein n=1 Tax=Photobacterium obscurum TaxID=2829490 RepID=UPI0022434FC0|nr:hypothetical protein [Photobacterium obscurum]MCW8330870.1 hypothetical protein [Photobacterium obscurum]